MLVRALHFMKSLWVLLQAGNTLSNGQEGFFRLHSPYERCPEKEVSLPLHLTAVLTANATSPSPSLFS